MSMPFYMYVSPQKRDSISNIQIKVLSSTGVRNTRPMAKHLLYIGLEPRHGSCHTLATSHTQLTPLPLAKAMQNIYRMLQ